MILGQIVIAVISYSLYSFNVRKLLNYTIIEQIKDILPSLSLSIVMGGGVFITSYIPFKNLLTQLIIQILVGFFLYVALFYIFKRSYFIELTQLIKRKKLGALDAQNC